MPIGLAAGALLGVGKKLLGKAAKKVTKQVLGTKLGKKAVGVVRTVAGSTAGRAAGGVIAAEGVAAAVRRASGARGGPGSGGAARFGPELNGGSFGGPRRYRRMNAGNAKALRRAFRRVDAFGKLAKKYWSFARPKQSGPKLGRKRK